MEIKTHKSLYRKFLALTGVLCFVIVCLVQPLSVQQDLKSVQVLFNRGFEALNAGNVPGAVEAWSKAVKILKTIQGTELLQADCLVNIGIALGDMGKYEESITRQEQALEIYKSIKGKERDQADCLVNIGASLGDMGKYEESITRQEQALEIYKSIQGTERDQATCNLNIGKALGDMGKYEEGIAKQEQALQIYQSIQGTERDQADCLVNIGATLGDMGKYEEWIARQEQGLRIYQTIKGTEREQAGCYKSIGAALGEMGKYEEEIAKQEQALQIYQSIQGTERDQADCLVNIGASLRDMGKYEEGIANQEQALQIYQSIQGTERRQAHCLANIGAALGDMGKYEESITRHEQAFRVYQTIKGTEREQAKCYKNIGVALLDMNEYEEGIARQELALEIYQTIKGTEREQATCNMGTGVALVNMGKHKEAITKYNQALEIYHAIKGTERDRADCNFNIGAALREMGKYKEAITKYNQALEIYHAIKGTEREQATCNLNIGVALGDMGKYEEGIARQEQALRVYQTIKGTERDQAGCYGTIGNSHLSSDQASQAVTAYEQAEQIGRSWWTSRGLGTAYRLRGQTGDEHRALQAFLTAVLYAELKRSSVLAFEHKAGIFEKPAKVFPDFVSLLVELATKKVVVKEPNVLRWMQDENSENALLEASFHFADRGKGRAMEDALREKAIMKAIQPDMKLLAKDRKLSQRISKLTSLREGLSVAKVEHHKKLTQDIKALQQRRNMIEVELKRTALSRYVFPEFRKPMEIARELLPQTAVLQYSIGEKEGWLLLLTRDGVSAHRLGAETPALPELLPRQEATLGQLFEAWKVRPENVGLDGLVRLARERALDLGKKREKRYNRINAKQERVILERLGEAVLPWAALLELRQRGIKRLLVIPDGSLHYVPFAMLRVKGSGVERYLIEDFSISYIPAMTTLETIRKQKQKRELNRRKERRWLLAFANPDYGAPEFPLDDMTTLGRLYSVRSDYYKGSGMQWRPLPETEKEAVRVGFTVWAGQEA